MTRSLAILLFDEVEVLDFCGPFEVFSSANRFVDSPAFSVITVSEKAEPIIARGGHPLSTYAKEHLIAGLQAHPTTIVFLAYFEDAPCGIATCFRGFSTFAAKPLVNISDYYVVPSLRGKGIGRGLMNAIVEEAKKLGCCKLTLEVQQSNSIARTAYGQFGFNQAVYAADVNGGGSLYMVKPLKE